MKTSNWLVWLSVLIAALAAVAALAGLLAHDSGAPFAFTTVRGETVQMWGQGLYRYEIVRNGPGFRGTDLFILVVAVPLLLGCAWLYRRGSLRGGLLLTGLLGYFLYNAASETFGYAYNNAFLVYLATFTASLFAFILACTVFNLRDLAGHFTADLPRRGLATYLLVLGGSLILVWAGLDILPALLAGKTPPLNGYTTLPTHALDMGVIAPAAIIAAALLLRRAPAGYLLTAIMVIMGSVLGAAVLVLTGAQMLAGTLTTAETMAFGAPFLVLTVFSLWCTASLFRHVTDAHRPVSAPRRSFRPVGR